MQSSFDSLGRVLGPTCGGWLYEVSPIFPFWGAAAVMTTVGCVAAARSGRADPEAGPG